MKGVYIYDKSKVNKGLPTLLRKAAGCFSEFFLNFKGVSK